MQSPPPIPQVKKQQQSATTSLVYVAIVIGCSLFSAGVTMKYYPSRYTIERPTFPLHTGKQDTLSVHAMINTTSATEITKVRQQLMLHLHEQQPLMQALCMHHMRTPKNWTRIRACVMHRNGDEYVFMQNMRIIGYDKSNVAMTRQISVACGDEPFERPRASLVYMEWENEHQHTHYMAVRGALAHTLQLYAEEFAGDKHCQQQ